MCAVEAAERIRSGALTSVEVVATCLERIEETDPTLRAWVHVDRDGALAEAKAMDSLRQRGMPIGSLHGLPIGIGEIFEPASAPAVVDRLKEAGAVIVGETRPAVRGVEPKAQATNPHDPGRTPGGESSAAAAAVAGCQIPLAITCEADGGVILSASYCGAFGFKPTPGIISRRGARLSSPTLDRVGVLGRDLEDVALLADALGGHDAADPSSYLRPRPRMQRGCRAKPPMEPIFIWLDMPYDDRLSAAAGEGFEELRDCLAGQVERLPAPEWFGRLPAAHQIVYEYESAAILGEAPDRGVAHDEERYRQALDEMAHAQHYFAEFFHHYDAIITPSAGGEAPVLASGPGDPIFATIWTLCGLPSVSVPLLSGETGLPIGAQLVGSAEGDDRLLRSASWLIQHVRAEA